jgi:polyribonucleotide nucleotidyltransferase
MMKDVEAGDIYNGKVVKTTNFGAFVELTPAGTGSCTSLGSPRQAAGRAGRGRRHRGRPREGAGLEIDKQNRISLEKLED